VSALVRIEGMVDLTDAKRRHPELAKVPDQFPTYIYRNYTVIRDGILNTNRLPVSLTAETFRRLQREGLLAGQTWADGQVYDLDLRSLPIINRKMVNEVSADRLFRLEWETTKTKAAQAVYKHFQKEKFERVSESFITLYGDAASTV
jgi:hypothetical protein